MDDDINDDLDDDVGTDSVDTDVIDAEVVDAEDDAGPIDSSVPGLDGSDLLGGPSDESEGGAGATARERDEYLDALRRTQADFENYRKRSMKQQVDAIDFATGRLVEDLLPVLDACEAGIEHGDEGVTAVFTALLGTLERSGLERLDPLGTEFDPNRHEAVLHEPGEDGADGPVVAEVMRTGYVWKGRVVRAAMVKVKG